MPGNAPRQRQSQCDAHALSLTTEMHDAMTRCAQEHEVAGRVIDFALVNMVDNATTPAFCPAELALSYLFYPSHMPCGDTT